MITIVGLSRRTKLPQSTGGDGTRAGNTFLKRSIDCVVERQPPAFIVNRLRIKVGTFMQLDNHDVSAN